MDTKNANGNVSGTIRLFNMEITAKMNIIFGLAKQKRNFLEFRLRKNTQYLCPDYNYQLNYSYLFLIYRLFSTYFQDVCG